MDREMNGGNIKFYQFLMAQTTLELFFLRNISAVYDPPQSHPSGCFHTSPKRIVRWKT